MNIDEILATNSDEYALVIRTCAADGTSTNGFKWPDTEGVEVTCPDWNPKAECGNGLHGLADGWGDWSLLSGETDARWQILRVKRSDLVEISQKVKFPVCTVLHSGDFTTAMSIISKWQIKILCKMKLSDGGECDSGKKNASIGSSGYYARIGSSGDYASIGSSGYSASIGSSGDYASIGSSGYYARIGSSGYSASIEALGEGSTIACAGLDARVSVGLNGAVAVPWKREDGRIRFAVGYEGEELEAGKWYCVDENGKFVEVK